VSISKSPAVDRDRKVECRQDRDNSERIRHCEADMINATVTVRLMERLVHLPGWSVQAFRTPRVCRSSSGTSPRHNHTAFCGQTNAFFNLRNENPTMSTNSWTSPWPSVRILPISSETKAPSSSRCDVVGSGISSWNRGHVDGYFFSELLSDLPQNLSTTRRGYVSEVLKSFL
jgi:hypothetical protein